MTVSRHDQDYVERLGAFEDEGHRQRLDAHLARSIASRLADSLSLSHRFASSDPARHHQDDPSEIYARARALGLYRPQADDDQPAPRPQVDDDRPAR
jgi:hypothetical protein